MVARHYLLAFVALFVPGCVLAFEAAAILRAVKSRLRGQEGAKRLLRKRGIALHAASGLIVLFWLYAGCIEPYRLTVVSVPVPTDKLSGPTIRLVQISDMHCEAKVRNEPKLAGIINPLQPDIVVFTGDALNTYDGVPLFRGTLAGLEARLGKYAVLGNMDVNNWEKHRLFVGTGFEVLTGRTVRVERGEQAVYLTGLTFGAWQPYDDLLSAVPPGSFSVLLYHTPELAESLAGPGVDLYLCGHTHGGQLAVPFHGPVVFLRGLCGKYRCGRYVIGETTLYVNPGIGMEAAAPRVRFGVPPQITVFDITPRDRR